MARMMVTQWGMSDRLGPIQYGEREEMVFLGRGIGEIRTYSDRTAQEIDEEVRRIVEAAHEQARTILRTHRDKLDAVAQRLLEVETIYREEFEAIMRGEPIADRPASPSRRRPAPQADVSGDGRHGEEEERSDKGLDLGGTLPAPA